MSPTSLQGKTYAAVRHAARDAATARLLDVAGELLASKGPDALSMRNIAGAAGCSTTVLYTHFGSKEGIAAGLFDEGFARLRAALDAVAASDDPLTHVEALAMAYRENALANPAYYRVMFECAIPGFVPDPASAGESLESLAILHRGVLACIDAGYFVGDRPAEDITHVLWAAVHGAVSLELMSGGAGAGTEDVERRFRLSQAAASSYFLTTKGRRALSRRNGDKEQQS